MVALTTWCVSRDFSSRYVSTRAPTSVPVTSNLQCKSRLRPVASSFFGHGKISAWRRACMCRHACVLVLMARMPSAAGHSQMLQPSAEAKPLPASKRASRHSSEPASQPMCQRASEPASEPACQPACQRARNSRHASVLETAGVPACEPASQRVSQRASEPASQRASEPASQRASEPASQRASRPACWPAS